MWRRRPALPARWDSGPWGAGAACHSAWRQVRCCRDLALAGSCGLGGSRHAEACWKHGKLSSATAGEEALPQGGRRLSGEMLPENGAEWGQRAERTERGLSGRSLLGPLPPPTPTLGETRLAGWPSPRLGGPRAGQTGVAPSLTLPLERRPDRCEQPRYAGGLRTAPRCNQQTLYLRDF